MKVSNYGDMLSQFVGKPLIAYVEFGSYQGEWVAVLNCGKNIELWKGGYGSCSVCDFIEAERDFKNDEISDEVVKNFFEGEKPFLTIPKKDLKGISEEEFNQIFPANVRKDIYDYNSGEMYKEIMKGLGY